MAGVASPEPTCMLRVIAEVTRTGPAGPVSSQGPLQERGRGVRLREGDVMTETERLGTCLRWRKSQEPRNVGASRKGRTQTGPQGPRGRAGLRTLHVSPTRHTLDF